MKKPFAVIFIHGLAKKPAPEKLQEIWLWGLTRGNPMPDVFPPPNEGLDLSTNGIEARFNYYADVFYGRDYETKVDAYYEANFESAVEAEDLATLEEAKVKAPQPETEEERAFLRNFEAKLTAGSVLAPARAMPEAKEALERGDYEIASWLPDSVKAAVIKKAAMEAYYFLFDKEFIRADGEKFTVRRELRSRLLEQLKWAQANADKIVIVSHSMGTMVAYDVLRNCPECPPVDTLITLGSPLGVREVQEKLIASDAKDVDFPARTLARWVNVYDPLDPVCGADPTIANDFPGSGGKGIEDVKESNWGKWRHTITHYLAGSRLRSELAKAVGIAR